jgi:hypothetical protein
MVRVAVHRKSLLTFPALDRPNLAPKVFGDLFPGFQTAVFRQRRLRLSGHD